MPVAWVGVPDAAGAWVVSDGVGVLVVADGAGACVVADGEPDDPAGLEALVPVAGARVAVPPHPPSAKMVIVAAVSKAALRK